ncbi:LysR family transcriptional regulator [Microvirga rosea]|uniref:LysR family transcriptional regulator n=1 Tax=Microvirga rosea TaxID=2715425 RepID=UPI001D0AB1B5|nr:LysR family transcriptional regulator [Microvirga rosea]MCB8819393.1 LysR family transcriptional regulator [Microvirga rosea]
MVRPHLPLNALRAFEAAARHLSFTHAAIELCVTQAAVSHQVKRLEERLGVALFRRLPRGLGLTDEGLALLPTVSASFDSIGDMLERFDGGHVREVLTVGVVGTFALGWLIPRLQSFRDLYPFVDLRLMTNNNRVDIAAEGLDYAVRFGDGAWHGTNAIKLFEAPLSPLCHPKIAERLRDPVALTGETLLRSYRADEWPKWFRVTGVDVDLSVKGNVFDSSLAMVEAARLGLGVALAPPLMFERDLQSGRLKQPFADSVSTGAYWLTHLKSKSSTPAMKAFQEWIISSVEKPDHL